MVGNKKRLRFPDHAAKHPTNLSTLSGELFVLLARDVATIVRKIHRRVGLAVFAIATAQLA